MTAAGRDATTATVSGGRSARTATQRGRGRTGTAAITLTLALSAAAIVAEANPDPVTGTGAVTLTPTVASTAVHVSPVTGTAGVTLTPTLAGSGLQYAVTTGTGAVTVTPTVAGSGAVEAATGTGALTLTPTLAGSGSVYDVVTGAGALALVATVAGAGTFLALTYGNAALSVTPTVTGAGEASGAPGELLFEEDFTSFTLRSRGDSTPFEVSYQAGSGVWTPRHMYLNSENDATYNNNEWAAFIDPTSTTVAATGYSPFSASAGVLTIRAQPKPSSLSGIDLPYRRYPGSTVTTTRLPWVSGLMTTRHSFWVGRSFSAEVEAWVEKGQASFQAPLWLLSREDYQGLEIDVMEYQGHFPNRSNWAVHGITSAGAWIDRGLGDLSEGWFRYGMTLDGTSLTIFIDGAPIGSATLSDAYADAHWYLIANNALGNWDDWSGPDATTPNPLDLKLRNLKVYAGSGTSWGGDQSPALSGDASWVADPVGGVSPTLHLDLTNSRLWQGGSLRHLGHVTSVLGGQRRGYGELLRAVGATEGTIVVRVDTPSGSHASSYGPILSPYEWSWMTVTPGLGLSVKHAGGDLTVTGFGSGQKTVVRSWDASVTKGLVQGGSVVSAAYGNVGYVGERMNLGASWYGDNPYAGTIREVIVYPSLFTDAQMASV